MILQRGRECLSAEEGYSYDRHSLVDKKSKSLEEREEEYVKARVRIFNKEEYQTSRDGLLESPVCTTRGGSGVGSGPRWLAGGEPRAWSSTDSSGYSTDGSAGSRMRLAATKASSFHGVSLINRSGPAAMSLGPGGAGDASHNKSDCVIELQQQQSSSRGLHATSPPSGSQVSESGSSCQSVHSAASPHSQVFCSHNAGDGVAMPMPFAAFNNSKGQPMAIWVASTLDSIPVGSVLINPLTVEPYLNMDGTVYRWTGTAPTNQQPQHMQAAYPAYAQPPPPSAPVTAPVQPQTPVVQQPPDMRSYSMDSGADMDPPVPAAFTTISISDQQQQSPQPPHHPTSQPVHDVTSLSHHQQGTGPCIPVPMATVVSPTAATAVVQPGFMPTSAQVPYYTNPAAVAAASAAGSPPYRCVYPTVHYMSSDPAAAQQGHDYSYTVVSQPYTPPSAQQQPAYGAEYTTGAYVYYGGNVCNGAQSPSTYRSPRQQSSYVVPLSAVGGYGGGVRQTGYSTVLRPANGLANRTPPPPQAIHYHSPIPPPVVPPSATGGPQQLKVMPVLAPDEGYVGAPVVQKVPLLRPTAYTMAPFAMAAPPTAGARLVGQPLQQVASPSYYTTRFRAPVAMPPQSVASRQAGGRKSRKDLSPHSSTESMESCGSALCPPPAPQDMSPGGNTSWRPSAQYDSPGDTHYQHHQTPDVMDHRSN